MINDRPSPHPKRERPNCPFWGKVGDPAVDKETVKNYRASEAGLFAVIDAIGNGDADSFKTLCETMEPRDYAVAAYFIIDFVNSLTFLGVHPAKTLDGIKAKIRADLAAALAE